MYEQKENKVTCFWLHVFLIKAKWMREKRRETFSLMLTLYAHAKATFDIKNKLNQSERDE